MRILESVALWAIELQKVDQSVLTFDCEKTYHEEQDNSEERYQCRQCGYLQED